jgi:PPP family 3-phenylpropionic acid transporter
MIRPFYFFFNAALSIISSFLPVYLESRGFSGTQIANIMALDSIIAILGISILWGYLSDRTQKPAMILQILALGTALSFIPILFGGSAYYLVFLGYLIFGFFSCPIGGISDSLAVVHARDKGIDFGKIRVWGSIGWLSSTLLVGFWLAAKGTDIPVKSFNDAVEVAKAMFAGKGINWNDPIVIVLVICGFAVTFLTTLGFSNAKKGETKKDSRPGFSDLKLILKNRYFLIFLIVVALHMLCLKSFYFLFGIHVKNLEMSPTILSIAFSVGTLAEILAFSIFGWLRKYFRLEILIAIATGISLLRWALLANTESVGLLIFSQLLHAATSGIFIAAAVSFVANAAEPKLLVTYQQVYYYAMFIGNLIGTYASGFIYEGFNKSAIPVFYVMSAVELLAMMFILLSMRLPKNPTA